MPDPSLALQPSPVGGRGIAARVGKQKGKHNWSGQSSPGGALSSFSQLLEGEEHPELIWYHPPCHLPSRVSGPSRALSNINSPSARPAAQAAAAPSHHGIQHSPRFLPPACPGSSTLGSAQAVPGAQHPPGIRALTRSQGHLPTPRHSFLILTGGGLYPAGGKPAPLHQHPFPR